MPTVQQAQKEAPQAEAPKKPTTVALIWNPYLDGYRDLANNPKYKPLVRNAFAPVVKKEKHKTSYGSAEVPVRELVILSHGVTLGVRVELWELIKKQFGDRALSRQLRNGSVREIYPENEQFSPDDLRAYGPEDKMMLIESCRDLDVLRRWQNFAPDGATVSAIGERLERLERGY
jgi:hypothetical protein